MIPRVLLSIFLSLKRDLPGRILKEQGLFPLIISLGSTPISSQSNIFFYYLIFPRIEGFEKRKRIFGAGNDPKSSF
jgi:hypothetical protein